MLTRMLRNYFNRTGFRRQLTVAVTAAILGLALFSSLMNTWEATRRLDAHLVEQGRHIAENLAQQSTLALLYHSAENVSNGVALTLAFPFVQSVRIVDGMGNVLVSETKAGTTTDITYAFPDSSAARAGKLNSATNRAWYFTAPVFSGVPEFNPFDVQLAEAEFLGQVDVVVSKGALQRLGLALLLGNLLITLSFAAILIAVLRYLTGRMISPLNSLRDLMGRAEAGESGMRAKPQGPHDISQMAHAFNKMMGVLEEREAELTRSRDAALQTALMKTQFAAAVSHEVRTPLNGVVGMLEVLKQMPMDKRQQECVDVAANSAHTLSELINDILDFSKMEAGKLELEEVDFDLLLLVEDVIELMAKQAQQKGLELGYTRDAFVPRMIKGDPLRLRQVLLNLIGNAIKFTQHGEVSLHVSFTERGEGALLRCEIADTGIGIDEASRQHIFESFAQADRSTTRRYGGTGLGLAISRQIVELMHGEIGVESKAGQGSQFWFTASVKALAPAQAETERTDLRGVRILIVDPSPVVRRFLCATLERYGALGFACGSAVFGLAEYDRALAAGSPYCVVIIENALLADAQSQLAGRLREARKAEHVHLIALHPYFEVAAAKPDVETLSKPLREQRLVDMLARVIASHVPASQSVFAAQTRDEAPAERAAFRVLVAEDNRTNQMVAAGMLAMNGCECEFAANGLEAVSAVSSKQYDLILMDCSMPEMDGYDATARIRQHEMTTGHRTPIVAMTANTQAGDADRCLAAGMDDYLPKPITLVELRYKLERWLGMESVGTPALLSPVERDVSDSSPLDHDVFDNLRAILGPSLQHTIAPFIEDTPQYIEQLSLAVEDAQTELAKGMAHAIKGSSGNIGALTLSQLAKEAEELANAGRVAEIATLLPRLQRAYDDVAKILGAELTGDDKRANRQDAEMALVLIVDDDRSTRSALRNTLLRDGFRVEEAGDGAQALLMLKRMQPDVILMDAVMPVMDGFAACARIQELPKARAIPVLMITALEDEPSIERAFAAGASDYIPKPIHFAVLSQRVRRIIEATQAEKRIRHMAYNDMLTGLPNRTLFTEQLGHHIERAHTANEVIAVLFLDLDRFKNVNDTLGHDVGDRLLVAAAQRIRRSVRTGDHVARLGGDEFTVILADIQGANAAAAAAQNVVRALSAPFEIDGNDIYVTASVGISMYPHDGADVGTLLKHADTAMYRAKKTNSGYHFFEASMEHSISAHMRLEGDLRRALERNEIEVVYQPQARVADRTIIGAEALLRWRHPTHGYVSPVEFIPLAEEIGLIVPLGDWVLRAACAQMKQWQTEGLHLSRIAVNLSVKQLLQRNFVSKVEHTLREYALPAHLLELEITESTLMENAQDTLQAIQRLRALGVRLSIDDFGTGYSSLSYLKRFDVDVVKIDRSFVRDVPNDADDASIATGIIALAHSLRLEVVAEGVENEAQLAFLNERKCDLLQGYLISAPLPAAAFSELVLSWKGNAISSETGDSESDGAGAQ